MAFSAIELTTITRSQDYTTIKQNEDNKPFIDQSHIGQQIQKETEHHFQEVRSSDNTDWHNKKFDAKDKGDNEYKGDGGKKRSKQEKQPKDRPRDQVIISGYQKFDMKI